MSSYPPRLVKVYLCMPNVSFRIDLGCWHEQCTRINQAENGVWCEVLGGFLDNCHNWRMQQANGKEQLIFCYVQM